MKTLRLPIIASIAFAISACSGGGGSSPAPTTSVPSVNPPTVSAPPVTPPQQSSEYQGSIVPQIANTFTANAVQPTSHAQADKLQIGDTEINLTPHFFAGVSENVTLNIKTYAQGSKGTLYTHLDNVKYGFVGSPSKADHLFFIGKPTQEMPTLGTASYKGNALIYSFAQKGSDPNWTSEFQIDFANRKLSGYLTSSTNQSHFSLSADITGNTFEGTYNGNYTKGGFFGAGASELSGVVSAEKDDFTGVYGAKKSE